MVHSDDNGPSFLWPKREDPNVGSMESTLTNINNTVDTVKEIVNTLVDQQTEATFLSTNNPLLNETFNSNNTIMKIDAPTLNEIFNSSSTVMSLNNTGITEMVDSNNTFTNFTTISDMGDVTTLLPTGESTNSSFISDAVTSAFDNVVTTTETIFNTISNEVTSAINTETTTEGIYDHSHADHPEEKTLYIVIGVLLGALLIILLMLLIIYKRYKTKYGSRSGVYCVTDLNEISISSCERKQP